MRLQLDSTLTGTSDLAATTAAQAAANSAPKFGQDNAGGQDSSYVSGTSNILMNAGSDRAARIQQLTALVQSGSYQVSSSDISRSMVGDSLSQVRD
jgi:anti-sigma28 factor (negative regulator of flagellin synthesis)